MANTVSIPHNLTSLNRISLNSLANAVSTPNHMASTVSIPHNLTFLNPMPLDNSLANVNSMPTNFQRLCSSIPLPNTPINMQFECVNTNSSIAQSQLSVPSTSANDLSNKSHNTPTPIAPAIVSVPPIPSSSNNTWTGNSNTSESHNTPTPIAPAIVSVPSIPLSSNNTCTGNSNTSAVTIDAPFTPLPHLFDTKIIQRIQEKEYNPFVSSTPIRWVLAYVSSEKSPKRVMQNTIKIPDFVKKCTECLQHFNHCVRQQTAQMHERLTVPIEYLPNKPAVAFIKFVQSQFGTQRYDWFDAYSHIFHQCTSPFCAEVIRCITKKVNADTFGVSDGCGFNDFLLFIIIFCILFRINALIQIPHDGVNKASELGIQNTTINIRQVMRLVYNSGTLAFDPISISCIDQIEQEPLVSITMGNSICGYSFVDTIFAITVDQKMLAEHDAKELNRNPFYSPKHLKNTYNLITTAAVVLASNVSNDEIKFNNDEINVNPEEVLNKLLKRFSYLQKIETDDEVAFSSVLRDCCVGYISYLDNLQNNPFDADWKLNELLKHAYFLIGLGCNVPKNQSLTKTKALLKQKRIDTAKSDKMPQLISTHYLALFAMFLNEVTRQQSNSDEDDDCMQHTQTIDTTQLNKTFMSLCVKDYNVTLKQSKTQQSKPLCPNHSKKLTYRSSLTIQSRHFIFFFFFI
eukprot:740287_1